MRRRAGALVLAAAGVSGDSAGGLHAGDAAPGIFHGEVLRGAVHGFVRAAGGHPGQLARAAEFEADADDSAGTATPIGANRVHTERFLTARFDRGPFLPEYFHSAHIPEAGGLTGIPWLKKIKTCQV